MSHSSISRLEDDTFLQVLTWVEEVVEGRGASLAQMMVSTVLGLIPFVGQAVDAYNILRCLYRISDTKGTGGAFHKLETAKAVFAGLEYGIDAYLGMEDEKRVERAVNKPTVGDGRQLSHKWIAAKIRDAQLVEQHKLVLGRQIEAWEGVEFKMGAETLIEAGEPTRYLVKCPYDRSLITVVGPNHNLHERAKGSVTPKCCKAAASHQIGTEFVLPTQMLIK